MSRQAVQRSAGGYCGAPTRLSDQKHGLVVCQPRRHPLHQPHGVARARKRAAAALALPAGASSKLQAAGEARERKEGGGQVWGTEREQAR